jgi:thioredoxin 1
MTRAISKTEFKSEVIDNMSLSLVQFRIEWSGACQIISPIYEELASSYKGQAKFFTVDVEMETGIDHEYGITELPTILFFRNGKIIDHVTGLTPKNVMISKIETALTTGFN